MNSSDPTGMAGYGGGMYHTKDWDDVDWALHHRASAENRAAAPYYVPFFGPGMMIREGFAEPWREESTRLKQEGAAFLGADLVTLGATSVLRGLARGSLSAIEDRLSTHLAGAMDDFAEFGMTRGQVRAAARYPSLEPAFAGERIDHYFRQRVIQDRELAGLIELTKRGQYGPDVMVSGRDTWFDVTTGNSWWDHVGNYEDDFGEGIPLLYR